MENLSLEELLKSHKHLEQDKGPQLDTIFL